MVMTVGIPRDGHDGPTPKAMEDTSPRPPSYPWPTQPAGASPSVNIAVSTNSRRSGLRPRDHRAAAAGRAWPPSPKGGRWEAAVTELPTSRQRSTAAGAGRRVRIRVTPDASKKEEKEALKREELPALPALPALLHFRAVAGSCQPTFDNYPHYPQRG